MKKLGGGYLAGIINWVSRAPNGETFNTESVFGADEAELNERTRSRLRYLRGILNGTLMVAFLFLGRVIGETTAPPINIVNPAGVRYDPVLMVRLYEEAVAATALELNGQHPKKLRPAITLELGTTGEEDSEVIETKNDRQATIRLKEWQPEIFACYVVEITRDTSLDVSDVRRIGHRAFVSATAILAVEEKK